VATSIPAGIFDTIALYRTYSRSRKKINGGTVVNMRNHFWKGVLFLATLIASPGGPLVSIRAQTDYPSKRLQLIIPYGAGAPLDTIGRIFADGLSKQMGQSVIALNKPGANGMIAIHSTVSEPADGYTLLILANGILSEQVLKKKELEFDIRKDLIPVARLTQAPLGLFTSAQLPVNSVQELIAYAKNNPGKLNYASAGVGSLVHVTTEAFRLALGLDMVHVPYPRGSGGISVALISGEVGMAIGEMGSMRGLVADGKVKLLATLGNKRSPIFPDAPTVSELGIPELNGMIPSFFYGIFVAPGTDQSRVDKLASYVNATMDDPVTRDRLVPLGYEPALMGGTGPADFRKVVNDELIKVETIVRDAKISIQ
jgi:tripartite-type tricarboxylate transporter receptor subunit TctC